MPEDKFDLNKDTRQFERFEVKLKVRFFDLKRNKQGDAVTKDISAKGLGIIAQEQLLPHTPLELWLEIPDHHEPLYMKGEVVWVRPMPPDSWELTVKLWLAGINLDRTDLIGISRIFRLE